MVPLGVRFQFIKNMATECLEENKINSPPVDPKTIIMRYGKIYETDKINDAFIAYDERKNRFGLFINTNQINGRLNWNYAHELGHILLGHVPIMNELDLNRNQRYIVEREAHTFARELLMPEGMIRKIVDSKITVSLMGRLKNYFKVSWTALMNRFDELQIISKEETQNMLDEHMGNKQLLGDYKIHFAFLERPQKGEEKMVDISSITMDDNMRYNKCPSCGNEDFSNEARYCKKCGNYLFNDCTNDYFEQEGTCGAHNVADALFCEYCGTITNLGQMVQAKNNEEESNSSDNVPINIPDGELPF
jgi:Zn-dependent peptidase ImmA (M78 family)